MRIACPGCAATYEVPDSQIRPGRMMQCALCDLRWPAVADEAPDAMAAVREAVREALKSTVSDRQVALAGAGGDDWSAAPPHADEDLDQFPGASPGALPGLSVAARAEPEPARDARPVPQPADPSARLAQELTFHLSSRPPEEQAGEAGPDDEAADEPAGPHGLRRAAAARPPPPAVAAEATGLPRLLARIGGPVRLGPVRLGSVGLGWVASVAVVLGGLAAMAACRGTIMLAWPPAIRLYAWIGLLPQG